MNRRRIDRGRRGFTLVEAVVAVLILGLAAGSLLQMLHWGWARYNSAAEQEDLMSWITTFRTHLRDAAQTGKAPDERALLQFMTRRPGQVQAVALTLKRDGDLVYARPDLFIDRNRNRKCERQERLLSPVFCFRWPEAH